MLATSTTLRPARPDDAGAMTKLINIAGEGLPHYFWSLIAEPGQDSWSAGEVRAQRTTGSFSWTNSFVVERNDEVASLLVTYRIGAEPEPVDPTTAPAIFVPLAELENLALDTQYVNVLATKEEHRNQGHGSRLLEKAHELAQGRRLSIIVSDANSNAMRLYGAHGYRPIASRPIVKTEGWSCKGDNWVLMLT